MNEQDRDRQSRINCRLGVHKMKRIAYRDPVVGKCANGCKGNVDREIAEGKCPSCGAGLVATVTHYGKRCIHCGLGDPLPTNKEQS